MNTDGASNRAVRLHRYCAGGALLFVWLSAAAFSAARSRDTNLPSVQEVREHFHKMLDRPVPPLRSRIDSTSVTGQFNLAKGSFQSETNQRVPFLFLRWTNAVARHPVVIALHGTGGNKESQIPFLQRLATNGVSGLAFDGRYHGARLEPGAKGSETYEKAIVRAWREPEPALHEHPFFYDTVWDLWRAIDYLQQRSDVDPSRIGVIGFSKGGIETWLGASVDSRVRAMVPAIAVQSFRWSLENDAWQGRAKTIWNVHRTAQMDLQESDVNQKVCRALWNKLLPGILDEFDCPSMIRLCAPRPLLILSGELDPNCPLPGAELAFAAARESYQRQGASDRLRISVARGVAHKVTPEQEQLAIDWLVRALK